MRNKEGPLSHQQRVTRLYRHALRNLLSWVVDRDAFLEQAGLLREKFDSVRSIQEGRGAVEAGEKELWEQLHPDIYVPIYMPGGTSFMRNPTPAPELVYPEGEIPESAYTGTNTPVWVDSVPITFRPKMTSTLVDFSKKNNE